MKKLLICLVLLSSCSEKVIKSPLEIREAKARKEASKNPKAKIIYNSLMIFVVGGLFFRYNSDQDARNP